MRGTEDVTRDRPSGHGTRRLAVDAGPRRATLGRGIEAEVVGPRRLGRDRLRVGAWVVGAAVLVVVVHIWGRGLQAEGQRLYLNLPPLVGHAGVRFAPAGVGALVAAALGLWLLPRLSARVAWPRALLLAGLAAAAWAIALAMTEGVGGLVRSPASPRDYLAVVPEIRDPLTFLSTFVERISAYPTHVRAHPPGMTLLAWTLARAGGGPLSLAFLEVAAGASAVPAVLIAVREMAGEARARAAAPFLALAPAAVTLASSGDALFMGVGAWAVTLVVLATGRTGRRANALAALGGATFGVLAFLSYGPLLLAAVPVAVAMVRRRPGPIAWAAAGAVPIFLGFLAAGFWWLDGLAATRVEYAESVARVRPYTYFVVSNLAAFAIVLGPAALAGLARSGRRHAWWALVAGALVAVFLADLSGLSKGEVERIWLPFVPWVLVATAARPRSGRLAWLAANVAAGLALELVVTQPW